MREIVTGEQRLPGLPFRFATSQRDTTIQLGLSSTVAAGAALGMYLWMDQLHVQQPYPLFIALATACGVGLLCTLNLQYSLYLLEITLSHLAHDQLAADLQNSPEDDKKAIARRWPLVPLFARLREAAQRIQHYAANELLTADLRAKALQQASETAAQAERNRIARELHDSIKQQIFSISMSAAAAQAHWQGESSGNAHAAVEDIQRSAKEAQVEMQALLQQLRPAPLENTSLVEALRIQLQALGFRTGAQVHFEVAEMPGNERLLPGTQEAIFRLVQEAFANIAKHARAQTIWLTLRQVEQSLVIEVRDDGQGFEIQSIHRGMGLNNVQERVQELHGQVEIRSQPGQGTSVVITLPLLDALSSPDEEARQKYTLERAIELTRRGYQLSETTAFLGIALIVLAVLINLHWSAVLLDVVVCAYGYVSGEYNRMQAALKAGRESKVALDLKRQQYHTAQNLIRLLGFALWFGFTRLGLQRSNIGWLLIASILVALIGYSRFMRRRYYLDNERYYGLLSAAELRWELDKRRQNITRSLTLCLVFCCVGLFGDYGLFVSPPVTIAQQTAYGVAALLIVVGISLFNEYLQIQRWRQTFTRSEQSASAQEAS